MKRKGNAFVLGTALVVLIGAWLLAESMAGRLKKAPEEEEPAEPIVLASGTKADIRGLSWTYGGASVELLWDEDRDVWVNGEDSSCPIDPEAVQPLVEAAANVEALMAIRGVTDLAQYGLETPVLSLTVTTADHAVDYEIGNQTLTGEYYLRVDGTDTVYTEAGGLMPAFRLKLEDLLALGSGPEDMERAKRFSVSTDVSDYELVYREGAEDTWYGGTYDWFARVGEGEEIPLESARAEALYELVSGIRFLRCVDWREDSLSSYGLQSPQGTAALTYGTAEGETKTFALEFGDYEGGGVYVKIAASDVVYLADGAVLDGLMYPDWEAMTPRAVCPVDMTGVMSANVELGGHTYEIQRFVEQTEAADANGDLVTEETVYYVSNGWTLDADAAERWFGSLVTLEAESAAGDTQGREEMLSLVFLRDSETWPEVTLSLWSYDSARYLCTVNGEENWFISREAGERLVTEGESLLVVE